MRLLVLGSTGVVGAEVIREALADHRVSRLIAVSRKPLAQQHPKLAAVLHDDFTDFGAARSVFGDVDAAIGALGMSWSQARDEAQYRRVTYDYVLAAAKTLQSVSPHSRFCFVSGHGAGATSRQRWARIKAETEDGLGEIFGTRLRVFRPGYIFPVHGRETSYWGDTVMRPFMPFRSLLSRYITDSVTVARALLYAASGGTVESPADNAEIARAASAHAQMRISRAAS